MKLSKIFKRKPSQWGFRGDPYFWDYLKNHADNMDIISPEKLEKWIQAEYFSLSGKDLTDKHIEFTIIEQFSHGGMSSGGISHKWWIKKGIPLLKRRLAAMNEAQRVSSDNNITNYDNMADLKRTLEK